MTMLPHPQNPVSHRSPLMVWLVFPLITLGIYQLYWYYKIHEEMARLRNDPTAPTFGPLLVLLLLPWTVIAPFISVYNTGNRIRQAQHAAGIAPTCSGAIGVILMFVFGLWTLYYQSELNKVSGATPGSAYPAPALGQAAGVPQMAQPLYPGASQPNPFGTR